MLRHVAAILQLHQPCGDDLVAGLQAFAYFDRAGLTLADGDFLALRLGPVDGEDKAVGALRHDRFFGHHRDGRPRLRFDLDAGIHAGAQMAVGIGDGGLDGEVTVFGIDARVDGIDIAGEFLVGEGIDKEGDFLAR